METMAIILIIYSFIMMVVGVALFCSSDENEIEVVISSILLFLSGVTAFIIGINIPSLDNYGKKMLHHQYTIEYTNRVNSQNQVVSRDTTVVWKK